MDKLVDLSFLTPPFSQCKPCLLYADDTLVLLKPHASQILTVKLLFDIFGYLSGLKINVQKSELVVNQAQLSLTQALADTIQCKPAIFPIKYLGLPLSDKGLKRIDYMPLIDKIRAALDSWRAPLLSIGGRIILTNAVLSAIPQYFMSMFMLPALVVHKIDQIRRRFFWHGHKDPQSQLKSLYMVSWKLATKPRNQGGLGIRDLRATNQALLMKWMWQWHDRNHEWWKQVSVVPSNSDRPWSTRNSPFWTSLSTIQPVFNCSTQHRVGDGSSTKFWQDNWHNGPLKYRYPNLYAAALDKLCSVSQCKSTHGWIIQTTILTALAQEEQIRLMNELQNVDIINEPDIILWSRSSDSFFVRSAYRFLTFSPGPTLHIQNIWSIKAPLRVMVFTWLMLVNRLATIDNLVKRGWHIPNMCTLCKNEEESVHHLFRSCRFTLKVRDYLLATIPVCYPLPLKFTSPQSYHMLTDPNETKHARQWETVTSFVIWRERCRRVFSEQLKSHTDLVREIRIEYRDWFTDKTPSMPIHDTVTGIG